MTFEMFRYKYVGICAGIKVIASLIFFLDWWLIRRRERQEKMAGGLTVGELVNSVVSLDKVVGGDRGGSWRRRGGQVSITDLPSQTEPFNCSG